MQKDTRDQIIGAPGSANYSGLVLLYSEGQLTYLSLEMAKSDPGAKTPPPLYGIDRGPALDNPRATGVRDNRCLLLNSMSERTDAEYADADEQPITVVEYT